MRDQCGVDGERPSKDPIPGYSVVAKLEVRKVQQCRRSRKMTYDSRIPLSLVYALSSPVLKVMWTLWP